MKLKIKHDISNSKELVFLYEDASFNTISLPINNTNGEAIINSLSFMMM